MFYPFTIFWKFRPDIIMMSVKPETKHFKLFIFPKVDVVLIVIWLGECILDRRSRRTFLVGEKQSYTARGDASGKKIFKLFFSKYLDFFLNLIFFLLCFQHPQGFVFMQNGCK